MRSILLYIMLCIGQAALYGQQLIFFKPENLLQLPSSETYNVMQDSKGYIWFSTEAGLCRYNGDNIKVFDEASGLPEEVTYQVKEDIKGNIWVLTSKNRILKYTDGKFAELPFTKKIAEENSSNLNSIMYLSFLGDTVLQIETRKWEVYRINRKTNKIARLPALKTTADLLFQIDVNGFVRHSDHNEKPSYSMVSSKKLEVLR